MLEYDEEKKQLQLDVLRAELDLKAAQALEVKLRNHITLNKLCVDNKLHLHGYVLQSNQPPQLDIEEGNAVQVD
jgi:hypothetical protein